MSRSLRYSLILAAALNTGVVWATEPISPVIAEGPATGFATTWIIWLTFMILGAGILWMLSRTKPSSAKPGGMTSEEDETGLADAARRVSRYLTGSNGLTEISERLAEVNRQLFSSREVWVQLLVDQENPQVYQHTLRSWVDGSSVQHLQQALLHPRVAKSKEAGSVQMKGLGHCFLLPVLLRDTVLARVILPIAAPVTREQQMLSILYGKMAATAMESAVLMRQNRQLAREAASANAAKTEFLATMSHEIRTPLNGVLGMAELLMNTRLNPDQRKILESLTESGQRLTHVIDDVLDLSRAESGKLRLKSKAVSLMALVDRVAISQQTLATKKGLKLLIEYGPRTPDWVLSDLQALESILLNLVNNAVKFTHQGWVKIRLSRQTNDLTCIEVIDTGVGIPAPQQAAVFESFKRAAGQSSITGSGLGLAICQRLTQAMGGNIELRSQAEGGSCFRVCLPLTACEISHSTHSGLLNQREIFIATENEEGEAIGSILTYLGVRWSRWAGAAKKKKWRSQQATRPVIILSASAPEKARRHASNTGDVLLLDAVGSSARENGHSRPVLQSPVTLAGLCQSLLAVVLQSGYPQPDHELSG